MRSRRDDCLRRLSGRSRTFALLLLCVTTAIASQSQTFNSLHSFDGTDGSDPAAGLVQATDGNFYGTTAQGGANGQGTVFKISPNGTLTTLYSFCSQSNCTDGADPFEALVQASNGDLYGTTVEGGVDANSVFPGFGTIFKINASGKLTTVYNFCSLIDCSDGTNPYGGLIQAADGNLYGTTYNGGFDGAGAVFKITPTGKLTALYSFCSLSDCTDGDFPFAGLVQATDGNLYGTTYYGGSNSGGTVFKITPGGVLTTLHSFCSEASCTDGSNPEGAMVQGEDGNLYGITAAGGANGSTGTLFKITLSGSLTTLHSFCSQSDCTDGGYPSAGMVQGTDGNLYGTTSEGGANNFGTVFKITARGVLTTLHSFDSTEGAPSYAGLVQGTNGSFFGTTPVGGTSKDGTAFSLAVGLGPFVETQTSSGKVGSAVKILGTNLTGSTTVRFNGTAAVFKVASSSLINATVPAGATTGFVTVVTRSGTLKSNKKFSVTP